MQDPTASVKAFSDFLNTATFEEQRAFFAGRGDLDDVGPGLGSPIGYATCSEELTRWLVAQGAQVDACREPGRTPLFVAASRDGARVRVLLALGADPNVCDAHGSTPAFEAVKGGRADVLEALAAAGVSLHQRNPDGETLYDRAIRVDLEFAAHTVAVIHVLRAAGVPEPEMARDYIFDAAGDFGCMGPSLPLDKARNIAKGLLALHKMFQITPPPYLALASTTEDEIVAPPGTWQSQHAALWKMLVPRGGHGATVQAEVIRVTGKLGHELLGNGGVNWDQDFEAMLAAMPHYLAMGAPLGPPALRKAHAAVAALTGLGYDEYAIHDLDELAVLWVRLNPTPMPLPPPSYQR